MAVVHFQILGGTADGAKNRIEEDGISGKFKLRTAVGGEFFLSTTNQDEGKAQQKEGVKSFVIVHHIYPAKLG
ncbi:MAG: hypothetical protein IPP69_16410 [Flavobacteriales bacterium]|nr:hypothetical protein [Flavobacteriales bacterium]